MSSNPTSKNDKNREKIEYKILRKRYFYHIYITYPHERQ